MSGTPEWPGGWYIYEDGAIKGPLAAQEAFLLAPETTSGKPRLVSRKGFTQWYTLKDLAEIFKLTEQMGKRADEADTATTDALLRMASINSQATNTPILSKPRVQAKHVQTPAPRAASTGEQAFEKVTTPSPQQESTPGTLTTQDLNLLSTDSSRPQPNLTSTHTPPAQTVQTVQTVQTSKSRSKTLASHQFELRHYFLEQKRLRLGTLRNPWLSGFCGLPLSLGSYWIIWFAAIARDVTWHTRKTRASMLPPLVLALIPLAHIYMTYRLAKLVAEMESQNRYRSVSPALAALFALIPPFAVAYLQDAVNRHWMLHVRQKIRLSAQGGRD